MNLVNLSYLYPRLQDPNDFSQKDFPLSRHYPSNPDSPKEYTFLIPNHPCSKSEETYCNMESLFFKTADVWLKEQFTFTGPWKNVWRTAYAISCIAPAIIGLCMFFARRPSEFPDLGGILGIMPILLTVVWISARKMAEESTIQNAFNSTIDSLASLPLQDKNNTISDTNVRRRCIQAINEYTNHKTWRRICMKKKTEWMITCLYNACKNLPNQDIVSQFIAFIVLDSIDIKIDIETFNQKTQECRKHLVGMRSSIKPQHYIDYLQRLYIEIDTEFRKKERVCNEYLEHIDQPSIEQNKLYFRANIPQFKKDLEHIIKNITPLFSSFLKDQTTLKKWTAFQEELVQKTEAVEQI